MTIQNHDQPNNNMNLYNSENVNSRKTNPDSPHKSEVNETEKKSLTWSELSESIGDTNKKIEKTKTKIASFQSTITEANNHVGSIDIDEKQKGLEKLEAKVLKSHERVDDELSKLTALKNKLESKLHESGPNTEIYRQELQSVERQICEREQLKKDGGGLSDLSSSLQAVKASIEERNASLAIEQLTEGMTQSDKRKIIEALDKIPVTERNVVIGYASKVFTEKVDNSSKVQILQIFAKVPKNDRENLSLSLSRLLKDNMGGREIIYVLNPLVNCSNTERDDVIKLAGNLAGNDGRLDDLFVAIARILPKGERGNILELAKGIITDDWNNREKADLISQLARITKSQRENLAEYAVEIVFSDKSNDVMLVGLLMQNERYEAEINSSIKDIKKIAETLSPDDVQEQEDIVNILAGIPKSQRENLAEYAVKLIASGESLEDTIVPYLLQNQGYLETIKTSCLKNLKENTNSTDLQHIANFVYDIKAYLGLDEGLLQELYLLKSSSTDLSGIKASNLDSKNLGGTDSKVDAFSKKEFETLNRLKSERTKIEKAKDLSSGEEMQTIELRSANVTEDEAKSFQQAIGDRYSPGKIGKYFIDSRFMPKGNARDIKLKDGKIIYAGEQLAISLYISEHYRLINGTLDNDPRGKSTWKEACEPENQTDEFMSEAQGYVMPIAEMAASGINKLPPYKGLLYRGASISPEKLEEFRQGTVIMSKKFFSCSTDENVCEGFAKRSAVESTRLMQKEYKPVLYVFNSENAKDIQQFVINKDLKHEEERIYPPGQGFRSVEVDEKTIPGLVIIHMQEIN